MPSIPSELALVCRSAFKKKKGARHFASLFTPLGLLRHSTTVVCFRQSGGSRSG